MSSDTHPPVRESLDFENVDVTVGPDGEVTVTVSGTQPDSWEIVLEDDPDPSIPEPEWLRWLVVGYHFGEYQPEPQAYTVARDPGTPPPGTVGIEIVGTTKSERVPIAAWLNV